MDAGGDAGELQRAVVTDLDAIGRQAGLGMTVGRHRQQGDHTLAEQRAVARREEDRVDRRVLDRRGRRQVGHHGSTNTSGRSQMSCHCSVSFFGSAPLSANSVGE